MSAAVAAEVSAGFAVEGAMFALVAGACAPDVETVGAVLAVVAGAAAPAVEDSAAITAMAITAVVKIENTKNTIVFLENIFMGYLLAAKLSLKNKV
ncbi:MAG: hypothetical protein WAX69_03695 [Victivallales bacterium]